MIKIKNLILIISILLILFFNIGANGIKNSVNKNNLDYNDIDILNEIKYSSFKDHHVKNELIGDRLVNLWKHKIDDILIKNDRILLNQDVKTNKIIDYIHNWRDIDLQSIDTKFEDFNPENIYWKQKVIFLSKEDIGNFYTFTVEQEYPLACWEVRHCDGTTVLYDKVGKIIGQGIPTPNKKGLSMSGSHEGKDYWDDWRNCADMYIKYWCEYSSFNLPSPTPETISSYVSDPSLDIFYEIAHGTNRFFQADIEGNCYYASGNNFNVRDDMKDRLPIKFAFIGSCGGMDSTKIGSFSYEFRKGQMKNTVTIGYINMEECEYWIYSLFWQFELFDSLIEGKTFKESYDLANARFPEVKDYIVFKGDENIKFLGNEPPTKPVISVLSSDSNNKEITFKISDSVDPEGDEIYYGILWNDGSTSNWLGLYSSGEEIKVSHRWNIEGEYEIIARASDKYGSLSDWSYPLKIKITKYRLVDNHLLGNIIELLLNSFPLLKSLMKI